MAGYKGKRRIMRKLRIDELSSVDRPAQVGARALLMKRESGTGAGSGRRDPGTRKCSETPAVMTTAVAGHSHLVYLHSRAGETSWATSEGAEASHGHPWILDADGSIVIGESEGHSHDVDRDTVITALLAMKAAAPVQVSKEDPTMPTPTQKSDAEKALETQVADLTKRAARAEAVAGLSVAHRAHYEKCDDAGKDAFLALDGTGREAAVKAAGDADPIVYTAADGSVFRKSDDQRVVAAVKRADDAAKRADAAEAAAAVATYEKRAVAELSHLPGTVPQRAAMLKAIDGIPDEAERKAALEALHAQDAGLAKAFETLGVTGVTSDPADPTAAAGGKGAEAELDTLARKYATDHKVPFETAYAKVLETPEGSSLYTKVFEGQPRAQVQ